MTRPVAPSPVAGFGGVDADGLQVEFSVNEVADPALVIDRDHRIINCNGPLMLLFHLSEAHLEAGVDLHDLVPTRLREQHRAYVESMFRTPVVRSMSDPRATVKGLTTEGEEIPLMVTFYPVRSEPSGPVERYAAIIVRRPEAGVPLWKRPENWLPVLIAVPLTVGWFLGVEGALEGLIGLAGVRGGAEAMKRALEARGGE